jgi:hypothetical protein
MGLGRKERVTIKHAIHRYPARNGFTSQIFTFLARLSQYLGGMKITFLALALVLCAHELQASLGETEAQLVKRYGKVQGSFISDTGQFTTEEFEYGSYHVSVTLLQGASNREIFTRTDKKAISDMEMRSMLDANTLGSKWEQKDDNEHITVWVLASRQAFAAYYKETSSFIIKTSDMLAFEEALQRLQEQRQAAQQSAVKDRSLQP